MKSLTRLKRSHAITGYLEINVLVNNEIKPEIHSELFIVKD